jgi:hypothetical protein
VLKQIAVYWLVDVHEEKRTGLARRVQNVHSLRFTSMSKARACRPVSRQTVMINHNHSGSNVGLTTRKMKGSVTLFQDLSPVMLDIA